MVRAQSKTATFYWPPLGSIADTDRLAPASAQIHPDAQGDETGQLPLNALKPDRNDSAV